MKNIQFLWKCRSDGNVFEVYWTNRCTRASTMQEDCQCRDANYLPSAFNVYVHFQTMWMYVRVFHAWNDKLSQAHNQIAFSSWNWRHFKSFKCSTNCHAHTPQTQTHEIIKKKWSTSNSICSFTTVYCIVSLV